MLILDIQVLLINDLPNSDPLDLVSCIDGLISIASVYDTPAEILSCFGAWGLSQKTANFLLSFRSR